MNTSIHHSEEICKRLSENNLMKSVKTVSETYVVSIMKSMFQAGYHGKTVDMERYSDRHRTNFSRFLRNESIRVLILNCVNAEIRHNLPTTAFVIISTKM